jgi:[ribosomal protein S5]-alanine N-acetyltransferase
MANPTEDPVLDTERFGLRRLTTRDATARYLGWLADEDARRYIQAASATRSLDDLRNYIAERTTKVDVLFLGIFERTNGAHIGNIKYEPINFACGSAEMGILVGESGWRGRGVAREVILASARWLKLHHGISLIHLGVESDNDAALRAYLRTGFVRTDVIRDARVPREIVRMALEIGD